MQVLNAEELGELVEGLESNQITSINHIRTCCKSVNSMKVLNAEEMGELVEGRSPTQSINIPHPHQLLKSVF